MSPVRPTFLHRHEVPTRRGNRHQQFSNGRTVGVPTQPKHKVLDLISTRRSLSWEDKDQNSRKKASKKTEKKKQKPEKERINLKNQNQKIEKKRKDDRAEGKPKEESGIPASSQNSSNEHQQGLRPERQHQISRHCFPLIYI